MMKLKITIEGKTYEVEVEVLEDSGSAAPPVSRTGAPPPRSAAAPPSTAAAVPAPAAPAPAGGGGNNFPSPLAGTVRAIKCKPGDVVKNNQEVMTLEAMKMETAISSPQDGTIKVVLVSVGDAVQAGAPLLEFE